MKSLVGGLLLVGMLSATLAPSVAQAARVYVRVGPPAAIVELRTAAPSARHVWIAGYHRWDGGAYVWVPGQWDLPPARHSAWASGHWSHHASHGWYWVDGHWR